MSIYPGRGGPLDSLFSHSHHDSGQQASSDEDDFQVEDEDDWMGDEGPVLPKSSRKNMSRFSQSVANEVSNKDYLSHASDATYLFARDLPG